jgi:hypothetical protein
MYSARTFVSVEESFRPIAIRLQAESTASPRLIVYVGSFDMCSSIYLYFKTELGEISLNLLMHQTFHDFPSAHQKGASPHSRFPLVQGWNWDRGFLSVSPGLLPRPWLVPLPGSGRSSSLSTPLSSPLHPTRHPSSPLCGPVDGIQFAPLSFA